MDGLKPQRFQYALCPESCFRPGVIEIRQKLREKKEWQLADEIRDRLNELNIVVEDAKASGGKYTR